MTMQATIVEKIAAALDPDHLDVIDESNQHNVPPGSESHFKAVVVSESFLGKRQVARHQVLYGLLRDELAGSVHALALHTYTAAEWRERHGEAPMSPPCLGGSKSEAGED
ncbi:MAG: BolA protein [Halieaceae bacterium]|jgi:BolA protein